MNNAIFDEIIKLKNELDKDLLKTAQSFQKFKLYIEAYTKQHNILGHNGEITKLNFSSRTQNCLDKANIKFIYQLIDCTEGELLRINNFGRKSLKEVIEKLQIYGFELKELPSWYVKK